MIESTFPASYIEYNGYIFPAKTKLVIQETPVKDPSDRTVQSKSFLVRVTGYITPRNINSVVGKYNLGDTVDAEMGFIKCRLAEYGRTLKIIGQGFNDIFVNTV